jgi:hypothetical protein
MNEIEFSKLRAVLVSILTAGFNTHKPDGTDWVKYALEQADHILWECGIDSDLTVSPEEL